MRNSYSIDGRQIALAICAGAALVEGFDTQSMGVAAPRVVAEFGLSAAQAGFIFSAATFGLFIGAGVGGRLADFWGRRRALALSLLVFGICSLATTMAVGPESLFAARVMTGLGLGGAMPNFIALSSESVHPQRRLRSVTLVMAAMPFGGATAAAIALGGQWGWSWRSIFYVGGIAPIVLSALLMLWLPEPAATRLPANSAPHRQVSSIREALFGAGRTSTTLLLWCGFFFTQLVLLLMLNWLPSLIVGLGFTRTEASITSIGFNLGGSLGAALLGRLHAGKNRRTWVLVTYAGMAVALIAFASVAHSFLMAFAACIVAGLFIIGAQLILFALAPLYYSAPIRGTGVGAAVALGRLGSVLGPLFAGGLLASGGSSAAVLVAIVPFVIVGGCAAFALTWRDQCLPDVLR